MHANGVGRVCLEVSVMPCTSCLQIISQAHGITLLCYSRFNVSLELTVVSRKHMIILGRKSSVVLKSMTNINVPLYQSIK